MSFVINALESPDESARRAILKRLLTYNSEQTGISDFAPLAFTIEDGTGQVIGGLYGRTSLQWLFIELLFVPEPLRGQGIGRDLVLRAESAALARGCRGAWLDTFDFQARGFYERLGYTVFGQLEEYPAAHSRFFLRKPLVRQPEVR